MSFINYLSSTSEGIPILLVIYSTNLNVRVVTKLKIKSFLKGGGVYLKSMVSHVIILKGSNLKLSKYLEMRSIYF
jgi:predicted transcriptional regulator